MSTEKGQGFKAYCCDCGKYLAGICRKRVEKNPNRRCSSCFSKTVRGYTISGGYVRSTSHKDGRPYAHRQIASAILGRPLSRLEVVHHKKSRTQNEPENLHVYPNPGVHVLREGHVIRGKDGRFKSPK
jgi:hypothetical protein